MKLTEMEADGKLGGGVSAMRSYLGQAEFTEGGQYLKVGGQMIDYNSGQPTIPIKGRRMTNEPIFNNNPNGVIIYNMENGLPVSKEEYAFLWHEAFTSDGAYYIDGLFIKDALTGSVVYNIRYGNADTCFNADDKLVVINGGHGGHNGTITIIDWKYGKIQGYYRLPLPSRASLLCKRQAILFGVAGDPSIGPTGLYKIDLTTLDAKLISSEGGQPLDCSFDGRKVLMRSQPLKVVNIETGSSVPIPEPDKTYTKALSFSSDGKYLIMKTPDNVQTGSGASTTLEIYDTDTGKLYADITSRKNKFLTATFIGDDTKITTIHEDNTIGLWDLATGELIKVQPLRAY